MQDCDRLLCVWQPLEDISCIAWNRQVQHILASASPSGRATVWDLRKNEPIIKVSDHNNRVSSLLQLLGCLQRCVGVGQGTPSYVTEILGPGSVCS